jgi:hypothetical protein
MLADRMSLSLSLVSISLSPTRRPRWKHIPRLGVLVLKNRPTHTVFGQRSQARKAQIIPALQCLPEVVCHTSRVLAENRGVVVAERTRDAPR